MGWLYSYNWQSQKEVEEHLIVQIEQAGYKVLDKSSCWGEFYALCEHPNGQRNIFVALIKGTKPSRYKCGEFGYKNMDESVHPYAYNCRNGCLLSLPTSLNMLLSGVKSAASFARKKDFKQKY